MIERIDIRALPGVLGELSRRGWPDAALALLRAHGGTVLYVPKATKALGPLARLMGPDAAGWLAGRYGGGPVTIPTARRAMAAKAEIARMRDAGYSIRDTARALGVSVRWVSIVTADVRPDDASPEQSALPL